MTSSKQIVNISEGYNNWVHLVIGLSDFNVQQSYEKYEREKNIL